MPRDSLPDLRPFLRSYARNIHILHDQFENAVISFTVTQSCSFPRREAICVSVPMPIGTVLRDLREKNRDVTRNMYRYVPFRVAKRSAFQSRCQSGLFCEICGKKIAMSPAICTDMCHSASRSDLRLSPDAIRTVLRDLRET